MLQIETHAGGWIRYDPDMKMPMSLRGVSGIPGNGNDLIPSEKQFGLISARRHRSPQTNFSRSQGFTLIELFIVLAIVGILVGIAIPGFTNLLLQAKLDSGVEKMTQAISFSRNLALNNNAGQRVIICPSTDPEADSPSCAATTVSDYHTGWLVFLDCDGDQVLDTTATVDCDLDGTVETAAGVHDDKDQLLRVQSAFEELEITSTTTNRVAFQRAGRATSSTVFNVNRNGVPYATITMNSVGNLSVEYHDYF